MDAGDGLNDGSSNNGGDNDTLFRETSIGDKAARATFLAIFVIVGFVGNSVLIATIAQSQRLKVAVMNLFIISIASVNVVDTLVNMTLILGSSISEKWSFGDFVCQLNAFGIQFVSIVMIMGLMFMSVDRLVAVKNVEKYRSEITLKFANISIVCSWVYGIVLSIPVLAGPVLTEPFKFRYLCSIMKGTSVIYIVFLSVFGYLIPATVIIVLYILIIHIGRNRISEMRQKEKRKHKKLQTELDTDDLPDLWDEVHAAKFVGVLVILWCICEGPYLLIVSVEQYVGSDQVSSSLSVPYPWQLELSFAWMRFGYVIVLPILTILWRNDFRMRMKDCLLCRKTNKSSNKEDEDHRDTASNSINFKQKKEHKENGSVPVLYATNEGLTLQAADRSTQDLTYGLELEPSEIETNMNSDGVSSNRTNTKCDVFGSQGNLQEETSDFEEEEDPLAVSNAQSVRSKSSHGSRSSAEKSSRSTSAKHSGRPTKEDVKAKVKSETFVIEKPSKNKRKSGTKLEKVEDEVDGAGYMDEKVMKRERNDSGRGSLERTEGKLSQQEKRKKKKQREIEDRQKLTFDIEKVLGDTVQHQTPNDVSVAIEELEQEDYPRVKKKKKRRKKRQQDNETDDIAVVVDTGYVNQLMDMDDPDIERDKGSTVAENIDEEQEKKESARSDKVLFRKVPLTPEKRNNVRALPQLPRQKQKTHVRTHSDDLDVMDSCVVSDIKSSHGKKVSGKSHNRSLSQDWDRDEFGDRRDIKEGNNTETPTPMPRKSKSKHAEDGHNGGLVGGNGARKKTKKYGSFGSAEIQLEDPDWSDSISELGEKSGSKTVVNTKLRKVRQSEI